MIKFLRNFENRSIKIDRVNLILILKSINLVIYFNLYGFGVRCDLRRFSVFSPFIEKSVVKVIKKVLHFHEYRDIKNSVQNRAKWQLHGANICGRRSIKVILDIVTQVDDVAGSIAAFRKDISESEWRLKVVCSRQLIGHGDIVMSRFGWPRLFACQLTCQAPLTGCTIERGPATRAPLLCDGSNAAPDDHQLDARSIW